MWPCVVVHRYPKNMSKTSLYLTAPLDTHDQPSTAEFIIWCNKNAKNNPTIFINYSSDANSMDRILITIYRTLSYIDTPKCRTILRKMQRRHHETGFPITIKTKCQTNECTNTIICTSKYPFHMVRNSKKIVCQLCKDSRDPVSSLLEGLSIANPATSNDMGAADMTID